MALSAQSRTRTGLIRIRFSKKGTPYVLISREDARLLSGISPDWRIRLDYAGNPPVEIVPESGSTTKAVRSERTVVTSVRVLKADWDWFVQRCRLDGTSSCSELRKWVHLAPEEDEFPVTF